MARRRVSRRGFLGMAGGITAGAVLASCSPPPTPEVVRETVVAQQTVEVPIKETVVVQPTPPPGLKFQGELEYWDWNYDARANFLAQLSEEWQSAHPGITLLRTAQDYGDAQTKLLTAASAGSNPPMANIHNTWRFSIQRQGLLAPYPDGLLPFDKMISTPFNTDPKTGKIYTCTFNYYCDLLFFNTELLDKDGIKPEQVPTNWDDYFKFIGQLTKRDASGKLTQAGMTLNHYYSRQWLWQTLVYQQGGWLYNEDGTEAIWNSEPGVKALQMIKDVYATVKADEVEFLTLWDAFGTGVAASYISQGYTATWDGDYPAMKGKWSTLPTPTFTGSKPDHAWGMVSPEEGFGVFANATPEQQEAAFSFIQYMVGTDEHVLDWALIQGGPPDRADLLASPRLGREDHNGVIANQGTTMPYRVNPGEQPLAAEKHWRTMFDRILLEDADPKTAADEATANFNAELKASGDQPTITERSYVQPA